MVPGFATSEQAIKIPTKLAPHYTKPHAGIG